MRPLQILAICALPAFAAEPSFCVTVLPQSLKASALSLGTAKDFGLSEILITNATAPVSRAAIMERLPIAFLFEWQAADVLDRKADTSKWAVLGRAGTLGAQLAPTGLGVGAIVTKDPKLQIAAYTAMGIQFLMSRSAKRAPDPGETKRHLLPDAGVTGDFDGLVVSGLVHGAAKLGPFCGAPAAVRQLSEGERREWEGRRSIADDPLVAAVLRGDAFGEWTAKR